MAINGVCIDKIILFIINTYCYITLIASGKSKEQFNRIISCFLGFNSITQIVTIAWLVIQFVYPANRLKSASDTVYFRLFIAVFVPTDIFLPLYSGLRPSVSRS